MWCQVRLSGACPSQLKRGTPAFEHHDVFSMSIFISCPVFGELSIEGGPRGASMKRLGRGRQGVEARLLKSPNNYSIGTPLHSSAMCWIASESRP